MTSGANGGGYVSAYRFVKVDSSRYGTGEEHYDDLALSYGEGVRFLSDIFKTVYETQLTPFNSLRKRAKSNNTNSSDHKNELSKLIFSDWSIRIELIIFVYLARLKSIHSALELCCGSFEVLATLSPFLSRQAMLSWSHLKRSRNVLNKQTLAKQASF